MITPIFWIIPVASILALVFAWFFFRQMMKESEGTELMAKIARHVRKGAMSYLKQQYKVVASDRKSTRLNSSHASKSRMPSSA